jgi:glyoxylase-like metal-dependent hydrolase (beta-lactamase superfamily II)
MTRRLLYALLLAQPLVAQPQLTEARGLAHAIPGELPISIGYILVIRDSNPLSDAVENAAKTIVGSPDPVFQVRYPHGWIMVDAAMDRALATVPGSTGIFLDDNYTKALAALRGAGLIVITHEHADHIGTVVRSAVADELAPKTMLTREQVETLIHKSKTTFVTIDSTRMAARRYIVVDYDRELPIAPGVVLIRAPGHTPGSQVVYVRLASGREVILSGDVAWNRVGIETETEKPDSASRQMAEDRGAIAQELVWLHQAERAGVTVVVSHDGEQLTALARQGVLAEGLTH